MNFIKLFRVCILAVVLSVPPSSYSSKSSSSFLLKAPQTSLEEFSAYTEVEEGVISYAQYQRNQIQKNLENEKRDILSLLNQAQESFLKDHLKRASEYFHEITKKAYKRDWDDEVQKIIFYSFLRQAQIESHGSLGEAFLHSAVLFAPHLSPDATLFPPPLVSKWNQLKKTLPSAYLSFHNIFPFHEVILINGQPFDLYKKHQLPYGQYRVTALSSSHKKWSKVISLSKLIQKRIVTAVWIQGSCKNPVVSKQFRNSQILFPDFCLWNGAVANYEKAPPPLKPQILEEKKKSYAWIWGVLGVVVAGGASWLLYQAATSQDPPQAPPPERQPTRKIGF